MTRRSFMLIFAGLGAALRGHPCPAQCSKTHAGAGRPSPCAEATEDFHGYELQRLAVDGCEALLVRPKDPLPGNPWVWRTMFWSTFQDADLAFLAAGFHVAYVAVGNTFGCPDAMKHFDAFYTEMTSRHGLGAKPALEGISRGGLYAYRWAYVNTGKVGCIYGDSPVCDMKSWPGGKGKGTGSPADWAKAIQDYHFSSEQEMMDFKENPVDILKPIAAAHIPIIHVCGDADTAVPEAENTDVVRTRYMSLAGHIAVIVKHGCEHHPHGLRDITPVVDFVSAACAGGAAAAVASRTAPQPGSVLILQPSQWQYTPIPSA